MGQSAFFGIGVGTQGLYTARTNLDITNHNIANAETEGYSRQYGVQSATRPLANGPNGMIGTGSEITDVNQYRDAYLDYKYWNMTNTMGEYEIKNEVLSQMELIFNEPSDTGYSTFFDNIFTNLHDLSIDPGDATVRSNYVASLDSFSSYMQDVGEQLTDLQKEVNFGLKTNVDQINFYAQQLATLNHQIGNLELTGESANDLRDERNRLIDDLSKIVNVDAVENTDVYGKKTMKVTINGQVLVQDSIANYLEVVPRDTKNNPEDYVDMYDIYWKSGKELYLDNDTISGELKGYIDLRDGNNGENFTGGITAGQGTTLLTVDSLSRTDIPDTGELNVDGTLMIYHGYTYVPEVAGPPVVAEYMVFDVGIPNTVDGGNATMDDVNGDVFNGTISWDSDSQIRLTNASNQDLPPAGKIELDGVVYTYTGYSKDAAAPNEITLTVAAPTTADGTETQIGDDMAFKGIPYYVGQLNEFVRTIAKEFNAINEQGDGGSAPTQLFTYEGYTGVPALDVNSDFSYEQMTIHNFIVNEAVIDDPNLVETSATANHGESANDLVLELIEKRHDSGMFDKGEPDNYMQSLIGELGIDAQQVISFKDGQESLLLMVENQRLSISGVDLNEETMNMLKYQQAYNVAAKIISIMDEIYDTTINRMGL